jgi:hypothetical protein
MQICATKRCIGCHKCSFSNWNRSGWTLPNIALWTLSDKFLHNTVIGDESLVHHTKPENRRQSMEFHHKRSPALKKFKTAASASKVTPRVFWDIKGMVHSGFMPTGTTINSEHYCETLWKLKARLQRARPHIKPPHLQHDNAQLHRSARTTTEIAAPWFHSLGPPAI